MEDPSILTQLFGKSPREWLTDGTSIMLLLMVLGRAWATVRNGGGVIGIWRSFLYGSANTEKGVKNEKTPAA